MFEQWVWLNQKGCGNPKIASISLGEAILVSTVLGELGSQIDAFNATIDALNNTSEY